MTYSMLSVESEDLTRQVSERVAKLLAEENLAVVFSDSAKTASFNTATRQLTLPVWKGVSEDLRDMLTIHECGHALYTPSNAHIMRREYLASKGYVGPVFEHLFHSYTNIVEDVRIDRLMQKRLRGALLRYRIGIGELWSMNFFDLGTVLTLDTFMRLSDIDKLNMYYKGLHYKPSVIVTREIKDDMKALIINCYKAETYDEVIELSFPLFKAAVDEQMDKKADDDSQAADDNQPDDAGDDAAGIMISMPSEKSNEDDSDEAPEGESEENDADGESEESGSDGESEGESEESGSDGESEGESSDGESVDDADEESDGESTSGASALTHTPEDDSENAGDNEFTVEDMLELESKTDRALAERLQKIGEHEEKSNPQVVFPIYKAPVVDFDTFKNSFKYYKKHLNHEHSTAVMRIVAKHVEKLTRKQVAVLTARFKMKQSAENLHRTRTSKSGDLDMTKLHSYRMTDNIFLSNEIIDDGKNHGLVIYLDCSGSMRNRINGTLIQLFALVEFCFKCDIAFEVYTFTNGTSTSLDAYFNKTGYKPLKTNDVVVCKKYDGSEYLKHIFETTLVTHHAINLFSYKKGYQANRDMFARMFLLGGCRIAQEALRDVKSISVNAYDYSLYNDMFLMNSTPLSAVGMSSIHDVMKLKSQYGVQKAHVVFLTDGEECGESPMHIKNNVPIVCPLTKRFIGKTPSYVPDFKRFSSVISIVKAIMPDVSFSGFYITNSLNKWNCRSLSLVPEEQKVINRLLRNEGFAQHDGVHCFDRFFFISTSDVNNGADELERDLQKEVEAGKTISLKKATKLMSKIAAKEKDVSKYLTTFADLIA